MLGTSRHLSPAGLCCVTCGKGASDCGQVNGRVGLWELLRIYFCVGFFLRIDSNPLVVVEGVCVFECFEKRKKSQKL